MSNQIRTQTYPESCIFEKILLKIQEDHSSAYLFISNEINNLYQDHFYYWKIVSSIRIAIDCELLPNEFSGNLMKLESAFKSIALREVVGNWTGQEESGINLKLGVNADKSAVLVRYWNEVVDDENELIYQEYDSFGEGYQETNDLIIYNFFNEQKVTHIKLVLHLNIAYKKNASGCLYFFQEKSLVLCRRVSFERCNDNT
ncbi:hypothetical protein [Pseudoalteromonas sp. G4]|uniref:hypothetical protein n=1 Tax=Pseudoalteromonas sp. G4 TaxID=2992761 RepID=UPI00237E02A9|nr:hypothetical protein [Pseudoalteromonas sp. G4]MDE3271889.1 hypothetical protein [Pseudoalteromonas sp. G4]